MSPARAEGGQEGVLLRLLWPAHTIRLFCAGYWHQEQLVYREAYMPLVRLSRNMPFPLGRRAQVQGRLDTRRGIEPGQRQPGKGEREHAVRIVRAGDGPGL